MAKKRPPTITYNALLPFPDPQGLGFYTCAVCGALVTGKTQGEHSAWHAKVGA
jgi:hypothetical protein